MMSKRTLAWLFLAAAVGTGCGKKGPLLAPLSRTPKPPTAIACVQRGDRMYVTWTNPAAYIDGNPLAGLSAAEIWALDVPKPPAAAPPAVSPSPPAAPAVPPQPAPPAVAAPAAALVAASGRLAGRAEGDALKAGAFDFPLAGSDYAGRTLYIAVLVRDPKGRPSEPGGPAAWEPRPLPLPPDNVSIRVLEDRLSLAWRPPAADTAGGKAAPSGYLVYRSDAGGAFRLLTPAPVKEPAFDDFDFVFGAAYRYVVRAAVGEAAPFGESADSPALDVAPKDVFPPAAPTGLVAVAGGGFVALSWEPRPEKDLAGYRVRRREAGGSEFLLLTASPVPENAFSDTAAAPGKTYVYAVSAVDRDGNEGPRAETAAKTGAKGRP